ncbi:MAG: carotenoid biosynthesis protein [Patescibacteria group bacterium]
MITLLFVAGFFYFDWAHRKMLLLAALYAIIFENFNMYLSRGLEAGYYYDTNFKLFVFDTPLFVILSWALLITSSYYFWQSNFKISAWKNIFLSTLSVVLVDLSIDIFAIRLNFWHWIGYSLNDGFFGVPAVNYLGWFVVTIIFLSFYHVWKNNKLFYLVPIFSYLVSLIIIGGYQNTVNYFAFSKSGQIIFIFVFFILAYIIALYEKYKYNKSFVMHKTEEHYFFWIIRLFFHAFSLSAIIYLPITNYYIILAFGIFVLLDIILYNLKSRLF